MQYLQIACSPYKPISAIDPTRCRCMRRRSYRFSWPRGVAFPMERRAYLDFPSAPGAHQIYIMPQLIVPYAVSALFGRHARDASTLWRTAFHSFLYALFHVVVLYTVNRKTYQNVFLIYSLQNLTDCDRIWYMLSWVNLSYRNVDVFCLTWIVSLSYLVKLSIRVLQVKSSWNCQPRKHTKMFLWYLLQNEADSDKVWYIFSWLNLP